MSRFKTLKVAKKSSIKDFVNTHKLEFAPGRGFYQLTKAEVIQDHKEIIVRKKCDGSFISGDDVRTALDIPPSSGKKHKMDLSKIPDFDVFIQSTSYNRALIPDTEFLYDTGKGSDDAKPAGGAAVKPKGGAAKRKAAAPVVATKTAKRGRGRGKAAAAAPPPDEEEEEEDDVEVKDSADSAPSKAPPGGGPGGPIDIVFSFDTTGSMYPCLGEVRKNIQKLIKRLFKDIPDIRISVVAHGDYQDARDLYDVTYIDFTRDVDNLCKWVRGVKATCGYDGDECYELVLRQVREKLSWSAGSQRSLVMIGDARPHAPTYPLNKLRIDWKKECKALKEKLGVRIYAVQALNYGNMDFYRDMAKLTDGYHLNLDQFSSIADFMCAICFRERGMDELQTFEAEVRSRGGGGMNRELHTLFDTLSGRKTAFKAAAVEGDLAPINPSRFQVLSVDSKVSIKEFVQQNSLIFKAGRGFYEFTKPEIISEKKEVVLLDKATGDMFTGPEALDLIGAGGKKRVKPTALEKWRVFVQSTSYNRVLVAGTGFLYEIDSDH